jgi:toxin ParE1/3/4
MDERPFWFHPDAAAEVLVAHDQYAAASAAAAAGFQHELENARLAIAKNPEMWASYLFGTRRYIMRRYPYVVVYRLTETRIEIIAVAHGHQRPGYWVERVDAS